MADVDHEGADAPLTATPPRRRLPTGPTARTFTLVVGLVATGLLFLPAALSADIARHHTELPWWALAACFAATETFVFHLEIDREAHSFSLSEVPLVVGIFFASPGALIVGRLVGELVVLAFRQRQAPLKLALNLSTFFLECVVAIRVAEVVAGHAPVGHPRAWIAAFLAVALADLVSVVAVSLAIVWHGGAPDWRDLAIAGLITLAANTSLALVSSILFSVNRWSTLLLILLCAVLWLAYRGYAALAQRYSSLHLLYDFTRMVGDSVRAEAVMEAMLGQARRVLRATSARITLVEPGGAGALSWEMGEDDRLRVVPTRDDPLHQTVVRTGHPALVARSSKDVALRAAAEQLGVRDCIVAPLRSQSTVVGTIWVTDRLGEVSTFDSSDVRLFETLANHAAVALENGRLIDQLRREASEREHEALHDALTQLPNRTLFRQRLGDTLSLPGCRAAVMLMDLDRFKEVNDTLGHHNGDLLLQQVATRLTAALPGRATIARLGGDEFAVVLPGVSGVDEAQRVARALRDALAEPVVLEELSLEVQGSVGIALSPEHGTDPSTLLKRADVAMYWAKANELGNGVYDPRRDDHTPRRLSLASELRHAIENGEILVHHQPKIRMADGAVVGTEALARWTHPAHGPLPPEEFVALAEHIGLIRPLTTHVLRTALTDCAGWRAGGHDVGVAVNLAVRSLLDTGLPGEVEQALTHAGVPAPCLILEITESSIMTDIKRNLRVLGELAEVGVQISIDDFGTGYSSLSYLQRLPVQEVKIDKSFVFALAVDHSATTIVHSIIELAHNLGLRAVAEGVEHSVSWERLRDMRCDLAQGYFLSRPLPAAQLGAWLTSRQPVATP